MQKKLKINKQNFQGEITSGFIVKLEKLTQENRLLGRQQQQKERGIYVHRSIQSRDKR